jgi:hypothetical protein
LCPLISPCENAREPSGSIKGRDFLDHVSDYKPFKRDYSVELINIPEKKIYMQFQKINSIFLDNIINSRNV